MSTLHERYKVSIPEGQIGDWRIEHRVVSEEAAKTDRALSTYSYSSGGRYVPAGTYTGLRHKGSLWMSDTPDEIRGHLDPVREAQRRGGHVLINGLGIGMVAGAILALEKRCESCMQYPTKGVCDCTHANGETCPLAHPHTFAVDKVTIIERAPEVIELVGPSLTKKYGDRVEIIQADAYEYAPLKGLRYSVVWHDIWLDLCTDNLKGMGRLHRKYGRRCEWQGSWEKGLLQARKREEKRRGW